MLDTLDVSAPRPLSLAERRNVAKARVLRAKDGIRARILTLNDTIDQMVQPNTAMLDRHHNVVEDARREALEIITTACKEGYDLVEDKDQVTALDEEKA